MRWIHGFGDSQSLRNALRKWCRLVLLVLVAGQLAACSGMPFWWKRATAYIAVEPPFLGPRDFQGSFVPRHASAVTGLQSTYSGTVAVTMVDRAVVQQMLPAGLLLAPARPSTWGADRHPVVHMIGDQLEPSTVAGGVAIPIPLAPGYQEMIFFIPFVVRGPGATQWHNYVVRMYLNSQIAVDGGNQLFGYAKELASLDRTEDWAAVHHRVATPDRTTIWFTDDLEVPGQWLAAPGAGVAAALPRWGDIRQILEMPFLGLRPTDPGPVCSYWELEFANAMLAATRTRHEVVTRFRSGMEAWETMGKLWNAPDGAVSMRTVRWRLALPPQHC